MDEATSTGLAMPFLSLRGGGRMPALGMGTWRGSPQAIEAAVRSALALGYRHFDCSPIYGNEAAIGEALATAIAAGEVRRDQLWITSKLWNDAHHPDDVAPALAKTLEDLKLDWLDLYLVHWPVVLRRGCRFPDPVATSLTSNDCPLSRPGAPWRSCGATASADTSGSRI